jgi:PST family polysaccharide transporter
VTDAVRAELGGRSVRSGVATVAARGAQTTLQLGAVVILARLLSPEDFGVQAMVLPVALLVNQVVNLGLQSAVIHREQFDEHDANQLLWWALRFNLVITGLMAASAPLLARLYSEPRVAGITVWWAATIYVVTAASIHEALLKRQLQFGLVVRAQLAAIVLSIVAAIAAALLGAGYRALMVQVSVMELGRAVLIWRLCPWRPRRLAREPDVRPAVRAIQSYWASLSGARFLGWLGDQMDRVLVGAVGGAALLGLYDAAKRWAWMPFLELWLALTDVAVATLSRARGDAAAFRAYFRNLYLPIYSAALPAIAFVAVEARSVVLLLLGPQWTGAIPFLRLLCAAAAAASLSRLMQWIYLSTGDTNRQLRWTLVTTPVMLLSLFVGMRAGGSGVAAGFTVATVALALPAAMNALRTSPVTLGLCLAVYGRPFVAAALAAGVLLVSRGVLWPGLPALVLVALRLVVFAIVYVATWLLLPGGRALARELLGASWSERLRAAPADTGGLAPPAARKST